MKYRRHIAVAVLAAVCAGLGLLPPVRPLADDGGESKRARVLSVDDGALSLAGLLEYGTQYLEVEMMDGPAAGRRFRAANELRAQIDLDKKFKPGDIATVTWPDGGMKDNGTLTVRDHWRLGWAAVLFGVFCVLLAVFGGWTGVKALFSFVFSCLVVWKGVIPLALAGWPASWTAFAAVCILTGVIMYLVAGATRKGITAFLGAALGVFAGLSTAHLFGWLMDINGATMPFVQALMYSGYERLDLPDIFIAAVVLSCSGAVMDLAMDIAAGVEEVALRNPGLPPRELFMSGIRIGRSVVGTMATTLLLAYSGGYLTLLMVFAAQGTRVCDFLNSTLVSAEVVKTLVGSFSLVLVAPFTALVGARAFGNGNRGEEGFTSLGLRRVQK